MKIASFDIGIKNMAYCIFDISLDGSWTIIDWNVIDLLDSSPTNSNPQKATCGCLLRQVQSEALVKQRTNELEDSPEMVDHRRIMSDSKTTQSKRKLTKKDKNIPIETSFKTCGKKAKYYKDNNDTQTIEYFCEKHAKTNTQYLIPSKEYTLAYLRKQKVDGIIELYERLCLSQKQEQQNAVPKYPNKPEMIDSIMKYYTSRLFSEIPVTKKNANDANLIQIGWSIRRSFESSPHFADITHIVIENQISPIATRMKTIQGMLAQYFIMKSTLENPVEIVFISSSNKLRLGEPETKSTKPTKATTQPQHKNTNTNTNTKNEITEIDTSNNPLENHLIEKNLPTTISANPNYKQHKKDSVALCSRFIESNPILSKWTGTMKVTKKDDLADCFLQGIWYMSNRNIITCAENLKINIVYLS